MSAHTPGPWRWVERHMCFLLEGSNGDCVADDGSNFGEYGRTIDPDGDEKHKANARLIASAPCLFYALSQIISDLPTNRDWLDPEIERMAKEAIAKAKGE